MKSAALKPVGFTITLNQRMQVRRKVLVADRKTVTNTVKAAFGVIIKKYQSVSAINDEIRRRKIIIIDYPDII